MKENLGRRSSASLSRLAAAAAGLGALSVALIATLASAGPTPEDYMKQAGPNAKLIPYNELKLDGRKVNCGTRPTVLDEKLDDFGGAYADHDGGTRRGFLILNPKLLGKVSLTVKLWIHAHECGHQFRGPDEETADCFAVQRGRRAGWLTPEGLEEVCKFISPAKGDSMHVSGSHRCEAMRRCYADPTVK